jgi:hypothetical protein
MEKVAFFGSRSWLDSDPITDTIDYLIRDGEFILVGGGSDGACTIAEQYALKLGLPVISFRPYHIEGGRDKEDSYGVKELRLHGDASEVVEHRLPEWGDWDSALYYRSLLAVDRCQRAFVFWDGRSPGTAHEIDLLKGHEKPFNLLEKSALRLA